MTGVLGCIEAVVDEAGVAPLIEAMLPVGVRPRQLGVRTILVGMLLALVERRTAGRPGTQVPTAEAHDARRSRHRLGLHAAVADGVRGERGVCSSRRVRESDESAISGAGPLDRHLDGGSQRRGTMTAARNVKWVPM